MSAPSHIDDLIASVYEVARGQRSWSLWLSELCVSFQLHQAVLELRAPDGRLTVLASVPVDLGPAEHINSIWRGFSLSLSDERTLKLRVNGSGKLEPEMFQTLSPHLSRAVDVRQKPPAPVATPATSALALGEAVGLGIVVLTSAGLKIEYANSTGLRMLARIPQLVILKGALRGRDAVTHRALKNAVNEVSEMNTADGRQLWLNGEAERFAALVQRENWWQADDGRAGATVTASEDRRVLLLLTSTEEPLGFGVERLVERYGFSPKEARVALGLLQRMNLEEVAFAHGVSIHTVRTQLKSAMQKVGATSQSALIAHISNDPLTLFVEQTS